MPVRPFSLLPDPDRLFWSAGHRRAVTMLEYGLASGAPVTLLTGNPGTGKTSLVEHLLASLPKEATVARVPTSLIGQPSAVPYILTAMQGESGEDDRPASLVARFSEALESASRDRRTVLVIFDEAQSLSNHALEEIRGLGNLNHGKEVALQILLTGQPEFRRRLDRPELQGFVQRAVDAGHLGALSTDEVIDYIRHRLQGDGGNGVELSDGAMALVARHTGGVPRLINKICDLALAYASATGTQRVTAATVAEVLSDSLSWAIPPALMEAAE